MRLPMIVVLCISVLVSACGPHPTASPLVVSEYPLGVGTRDLRSVRLRVSSGALAASSGGWLHVAVPGMRAEASDRSSGDDAELRFVYRGRSVGSSPLADGTLRRQIGIKLRAQDTCNVVYVMWHFEPTFGIHVSVKSNPHASRHAECGAGGYANVPPAYAAPVPIAAKSAVRVLRAAIYGDRLKVWVDENVVWEGALPPAAMTLEGPIGVRSDNGEFDFTLHAH